MRGGYMKHVDYDWACKISKGHGMACYYRNPKGLLVIDYIGSYPRYVIWKYNMILFFRFLKRFIKEEVT